MQHTLVIGAGRSATALIQYLLDQSKKHDWRITIAEKNIELAKSKIAESDLVMIREFDIKNDQQLDEILHQKDLVISMLPANFHGMIARKCADLGIHFLTASYITDEIKSLDQAFKEKGKTAIMELGLDPGIDHMSAMKILDRLRDSNYQLTGFETFTGGLIADDSAGDNPWKYKFTWNPRNVVLAGQGTVRFIQEGKYKYIPYQKLFRQTEMIYIPELGYFEGYANRDSLKYLDVYGLRGTNTLYRGTLRRPGFCKAWDVFVQLGATDDTYEMEGVSTMTHRQFINSFLSFNPHDSIELKLAHYMNIEIDSEIMFKLKWIGFFDDEIIGLENGTPAQILEHILKKKWSLETEDKDQIVMWHKFNYRVAGVPKMLESSMVVTGENQEKTAMAMTVGLPLGIAAKNILQGKIQRPGVSIPIFKDIYVPILKELEESGITFQERELVTETIVDINSLSL